MILLFIIDPYIYTIKLRDYIATLPWIEYHGFQNTTGYGLKLFNIIFFYKKGGVFTHC